MAPTGLVARIMTLYKGEKEPVPPAISTTVAILILVVYTLIYVLPFYISSTTRPSPILSRDAPSVIKSRTQAVIVSCIICSITTLAALCSLDDEGLFEALHRMGYFPIGIVETAKAVALTATLFLGPLFEAGVVEGRWKGWLRLDGIDAVLGSWMGWRNLVTGPVTEEVLFRSAAVPFLLLSRAPTTTTIFLTPIVFGLAHLHHFYEFRITHPHTPVLVGILRSLLQLTYTTLFGGYATFLFLRTGSLLSVILVHTFCNWMGFPRFWGKVSAGEAVIGPDVGEGKREDGRRSLGEGELGIQWTIAYYVLLVVGAVGWWKLLWPLTETSSALSAF